MSRQFVFAKKDGTASHPTGFSFAMAAASRHLIAGRGEFRLKKNDEDTGPRRQRLATLAKLAKRVRAGEVGDTFRVYDRDETMVFRIREAKPPLVIVDTNGNDKADFAWSSVKAQFPSIWFLGAYVCKNILGTSTHSQHSYGDAVDIGASAQFVLEEIANWCVARADELQLEHVIVGAMVWTRGVGWHAYTGEYHAHVHLDFHPNVDPSLPCGVRES